MLIILVGVPRVTATRRVGPPVVRRASPQTDDVRGVDTLPHLSQSGDVTDKPRAVLDTFHESRYEPCVIHELFTNDYIVYGVRIHQMRD